MRSRYVPEGRTKIGPTRHGSRHYIRKGKDVTYAVDHTVEIRMNKLCSAIVRWNRIRLSQVIPPSRPSQATQGESIHFASLL